MLKKSTTAELAHVKGIYREAINLRRDGWIVMANHIPGFNLPPEIEGCVPDIYAVKESKTLILEVETQGGDNPEQHLALQKYANSFDNIIFEIWIVGTAGTRLCNEVYKVPTTDNMFAGV